MMLEHLRRMARYNAWANRQLYDVCAQLPEAEYRKPRQAFFGSIHGTLNHLLVVDWIWLARIEGKGSPEVRLDDQPCGSLAELREARTVEDARMVRLVDGYAEDELTTTVHYRLITRPEETVSRQPRTCINVDLPLPLGPMIAANSPGSMVRLIPSRARIC